MFWKIFLYIFLLISEINWLEWIFRLFVTQHAALLSSFGTYICVYKTKYYF